MKWLKYSHFLLFGLIFFGAAILYKNSFGSYFFQDDWYSFKISQVKTPIDIARFFLPRTNLIYYRPLGMQIPFYLVQSLFGINPLPFRIATMIIHLINGYLLWFILKRFVTNKTLPIFGTLLYLFSATHFTVFFWAATFAFVLAPFFYFGSFLSFLEGKQTRSFCLFVIGLFANELLVTLPLVLSFYVILKKPKSYKSLIPFLLISILYAGFRLILAKPTGAESYVLVSSLQELLINLRNFSLWTSNWPETMSDQFLKFFQLNPEFIKSFHEIILVQSVNSFAFILIIVSGVYLGTKKGKKHIALRNYILGLGWFILSLLPVIFFAHHAYTYYLPIALGGFILITIEALEMVADYLNTKVWCGVITLLIVTWFISSYQTIGKNILIHWAPQRAIRAYSLTRSIISSHPKVPTDSIIIIDKESENKWALSDQAAFQVLYNDQTIETFYGRLEEYQIMHPDSPKNVVIK